jgi:C4-dicarboxylate-specific signal transduction histidine kinase
VSDAQVWQQRFERERAARKEAESLLHDKSRALYLANQELEARAADLAVSLAQLREAQAQLVEREKLAALGGLVAGVAHEINTPLGAAVTAATHAADRLGMLDGAATAGTLTRTQMRDLLGESRTGLRLAIDNLSHASQLVKSFKKVAVDQSSEAPREVDLAELINDVLMSLRPGLRRSGVECTVDAPGLLWMRLDAGALVQVLTNLIQNACLHAFDGINEAHRLELGAKVHDGALHLVIADNGCGMTPAVAARVFEPFFTTRRSAGGSGLGMHIVHNVVVQRFGGEIALETSPGAGCCWRLRLPLGSPALQVLREGVE